MSALQPTTIKRDGAVRTADDLQALEVERTLRFFREADPDETLLAVHYSKYVVDLIRTLDEADSEVPIITYDARGKLHEIAKQLPKKGAFRLYLTISQDEFGSLKEIVTQFGADHTVALISDSPSFSVASSPKNNGAESSAITTLEAPTYLLTEGVHAERRQWAETIYDLLATKSGKPPNSIELSQLFQAIDIRAHDENALKQFVIERLAGYEVEVEAAHISPTKDYPYYDRELVIIAKVGGEDEVSAFSVPFIHRNIEPSALLPAHNPDVKFSKLRIGEQVKVLRGCVQELQRGGRENLNRFLSVELLPICAERPVWAVCAIADYEREMIYELYLEARSILDATWFDSEGKIPLALIRPTEKLKEIDAFFNEDSSSAQGEGAEKRATLEGVLQGLGELVKQLSTCSKNLSISSNFPSFVEAARGLVNNYSQCSYLFLADDNCMLLQGDATELVVNRQRVVSSRSRRCLAACLQAFCIELGSMMLTSVSSTLSPSQKEELLTKYPIVTKDSGVCDVRSILAPLRDPIFGNLFTGVPNRLPTDTSVTPSQNQGYFLQLFAFKQFCERADCAILERKNEQAVHELRLAADLLYVVTQQIDAQTRDPHVKFLINQQYGGLTGLNFLLDCRNGEVTDDLLPIIKNLQKLSRQLTLDLFGEEIVEGDTQTLLRYAATAGVVDDVIESPLSRFDQLMITPPTSSPKERDSRWPVEAKIARYLTAEEQLDPATFAAELLQEFSPKLIGHVMTVASTDGRFGNKHETRSTFDNPASSGALTSSQTKRLAALEKALYPDKKEPPVLVVGEANRLPPLNALPPVTEQRYRSAGELMLERVGLPDDEIRSVSEAIPTITSATVNKNKIEIEKRLQLVCSQIPKDRIAGFLTEHPGIWQFIMGGRIDDASLISFVRGAVKKPISNDERAKVKRYVSWEPLGGDEEDSGGADASSRKLSPKVPSEISDQALAVVKEGNAEFLKRVLSLPDHSGLNSALNLLKFLDFDDKEIIKVLNENAILMCPEVPGTRNLEKMFFDEWEPAMGAIHINTFEQMKDLILNNPNCLARGTRRRVDSLITLWEKRYQATPKQLGRSVMVCKKILNENPDELEERLSNAQKSIRGRGLLVADREIVLNAPNTLFIGVSDGGVNDRAKVLLNAARSVLESSVDDKKSSFEISGKALQGALSFNPEIARRCADFLVKEQQDRRKQGLNPIKDSPQDTLKVYIALCECVRTDFLAEYRVAHGNGINIRQAIEQIRVRYPGPSATRYITTRVRDIYHQVRSDPVNLKRLSIPAPFFAES